MQWDQDVMLFAWRMGGGNDTHFGSKGGREGDCMHFAVVTQSKETSMI